MYFVGLDLGKRMDHAAIAVLERVEETKYEFDPVRFERKALVTATY